jgi:hypothetical protein
MLRICRQTLIEATPCVQNALKQRLKALQQEMAAIANRISKRYEGSNRFLIEDYSNELSGQSILGKMEHVEYRLQVREKKARLAAEIEQRI